MIAPPEWAVKEAEALWDGSYDRFGLRERLGRANSCRILALALAAARAEGRAERFSGWLPTAENINALPGPIRGYICDLETRADPAGEVRELVVARDTIRQLEAKLHLAKAEGVRDGFHQAAALRSTLPVRNAPEWNDALDDYEKAILAQMPEAKT